MRRFLKASARSLALSLCLLCLCTSQAFADPGRLYIAAGVENWVAPSETRGGRGYGLVTYQKDNVARETDLDLTFNTDTLMFSARDFKLSDSVRLGGFVKGEARFAGLLVDYYEEGINQPERGFSAGFVQSALQLDIKDAPVFIQFELGGRRWFFNRLDTTAEDLVLPPDMWVFEPRLRLTYWKIEHDGSITDPHRHYWRVQGWGIGTELGSDYRRGWSPWGQLADEDASGQLRNSSGDQPLFGRVWLRAGKQVTDRFRLQTALFLALGRDEDDLTRVRVGGLNPYVVSLAGMPWASHLPQNFGSVQLSTHVRIAGEHEVGLLIDHLQMSQADARRADYTVDTDGLGAGLQGVGLFGDFRWGKGWQVHTRAGYTLPSEYLAESPHIDVWISAGKQIF